MISDKILYDKQIELYVKQMFQLELFECFKIIQGVQGKKKKLNKPEIALRLCKAPQCTKFFIEIRCLGINNVL